MNGPAEIWIDAAGFTERGGWKLDTQFAHLMGSGYLIAADEPGVPVEDAELTVNIPEDGRYRVWVRDRNWLRTYSPGKFSLLVNGENSGRVLGIKPSDRWLWEIAGEYELKKGPCGVALHDLSGYFGRCAALIFTKDMDYYPPAEIEAIRKERARMKQESAETAFGGNYDFIVVGGGPGGVPAALAAARLGAKTLLIQDRPMLGGNGSSEIGITFDGAGVLLPYARETGIAEEIRRLRDRVDNPTTDWSDALKELTDREENLTVIYDNHVIAADMADSSAICGVTSLNILTQKKTRFTAGLFADCTGDGWLGYYAGAKYRYGRESSSQHGESFAPETADTVTMSGCIKSGNRPYFIKTEEEQSYHAPEWVKKLPADDEEFCRDVDNRPTLSWWIEASNDFDDILDGEETRDELFMCILAFLDRQRNVWKGRDRLKYYKFRFPSAAIGRRESRRLLGDYILTQDDVISGRVFDDAVAYTGWPIDIHHPEGLYSGRKGPMYCYKFVPMPTVPYRCLYSKNIDNLLFAGRNISATHIALGTVRVENTIATLGQAVGTAAALCVKLSAKPREIYQKHIRFLQQTLIRNDQYIPGFKNEDPGDPCLTAQATASSTDPEHVFRTTIGAEGPLLPMDRPRYAKGPFWKMGEEIHRIYLRLASALSEPCTVTVHVSVFGRAAYGRPLQEFDTSAVVPALSDGWVAFPAEIRKEDDPSFDRMYLRVEMGKNDGISWHSDKNMSFYFTTAEMNEEDHWKIRGGTSPCFSVTKPERILADCSPANVINGCSRIVSPDAYEWVSDPKKSLPQWIELQFKEPAVINTVSLVFDTDINSPGTCWSIRVPAVPDCVRDYTLELFDGKDWVKAADVTGNFMRKRTHRFDSMSAEKIRVTVTATNGDRSAKITEIRAGLEG